MLPTPTSPNQNLTDRVKHGWLDYIKNAIAPYGVIQMATIKERIAKDGTPLYTAEIRLKSYPNRRQPSNAKPMLKSGFKILSRQSVKGGVSKPPKPKTHLG